HRPAVNSERAKYVDAGVADGLLLNCSRKERCVAIPLHADAERTLSGCRDSGRERVCKAPASEILRTRRSLRHESGVIACWTRKHKRERTHLAGRNGSAGLVFDRERDARSATCYSVIHRYDLEADAWQRRRECCSRVSADDGGVELQFALRG